MKSVAKPPLATLDVGVVKGSGSRLSRRERLLDRAARFLNTRGVSQTSLLDVAADFGVSRAALYYYVDDRQDLVFQCYRRACEVTAHRLEVSARGGGSATEIVARFVASMLDNEDLEIAALSEIAFLHPDQQATIQGLHQGVVARLAMILETGAREGSLRPCDAGVAARVILSMISWVPLSRRWSIAVEPRSRSRLIKAILRAIFDGIAAERRLPLTFRPMDLSPIEFKPSGAFDREAQAAAKREALLATASRLFNRKGVDATSLDEIAAHVGVTKRVLYHHVGDKEALVLACYRRSYAMSLYLADQNRTYSGGRLSAIAAVTHAHAIVCMRDDLCPLRPLVGFDGLSAEGQAEANANSIALTQAYGPIIKLSSASGELIWRDPQEAMTISPGIDAWLAKETIPPERHDHVAREIADLVCVGLKPV